MWNIWLKYSQWWHDICCTLFSVPFCVSGHEVVIVKNGQRICGSGGALASAPLVQSKAYFEVKIQQSGNYDKYLQLSDLSVL